MTNTDLGVHQMKGLIGEVYRLFTFHGQKLLCF